MPSPYVFADQPLSHLISLDTGVWVYCVCGRNDLLKPTHTLARNKDLSLWQLMDRLKCSKCGKTGSVTEITICPMITVGQEHWARRTDL